MEDDPNILVNGRGPQKLKKKESLHSTGTSRQPDQQYKTKLYWHNQKQLQLRLCSGVGSATQ
jgi:hypothetical protein